MAAEKKKLLDSHYSYLCDQWVQFEKLKHNWPPSLLSLEAANELKAFREFVKFETSRVIEADAFERFENEMEIKAEEGKKAVRSIENALRSSSVLDKLLAYFDFDIEKLRDLLKKCVVSLTAPSLGSPAREAINSARKFLRQQWADQLEQKNQSLLSVHKCAGKTVLHLGSGAFGSVFITLPHSLDPETLAYAFISKIRNAAGSFFKSGSTVAIVDGAHQNINFNKLFPDNNVIRSIKDDCELLGKNLKSMLEAEAPTAQNSTLHIGIPADAVELDAVFKSGGADWDMWGGVADTWKDHASRRGFERPPAASARQVLDSLTTSKNVIVVIAHANERTIFLPAPPPEGSVITTAQVLERKDEIMANRPMVYLFCCETAEISDLKNFTEVLIECGAAGVIAPQKKIDAEKSIDFFDHIVANERSAGSALANIRAAQKRSGYREMEVWLG